MGASNIDADFVANASAVYEKATPKTIRIL
jgi:hypothetical protein